MKIAKNSTRFLRITLFTGFILLVLTGIVLAVLLITWNTSERGRQETFSRLLREYDISAGVFFGTEREVEHLHAELDLLEKRAISVESWLSIIKRRRTLSHVHPPSLVFYQNSVNNALAAYPTSPVLAAIAAAALVKNSAIGSEAERQIRTWLSLITDSSFNSLRLGLHVILGDFRNTGRAYSAIPEGIASDGTEVITVNLAVLKTLRGNYHEAAADIQSLFTQDLSENAIRFSAEFHYDFGNLQRSAEIFSLLDDDNSMSRQADALYLAGYREMSASIWQLLSDSSDENSLYNMAVLAQEQNQTEAAARYFERLSALDISSNSRSRQFGIIRYSRLLDYNRAAAVLSNSTDFSPAAYPYIDLEICRLNMQVWPLARQMAETWMLLDRHNESEELYKWAAWHIFFQRNYNESAIFIDRLDMLRVNTHWAQLYRAIQLMHDGSLDAAENILLSIPHDEAEWAVFANLGRIYEVQRSSARALTYYEAAASRVINPKTAARIQLRIAACYSAIGRTADARRALLIAVDLDPENLTAKLELDRMLY